MGLLAARIIGRDPQSDLAVIRVGRSLPVACTFGDPGDVRVGQSVFAAGFPANTTQPTRATHLSGRLTSLRRSLQGALDPTQRRDYANLLESSIPLPQGCSGGPLIDAHGRVIGINTAAATDDRTGRRNGYAIPVSAHVRSIIARIQTGRSAQHAYVGLWVGAVGPASARSRAGQSDVVVEKVVQDSPAQRAGLRVGDVVLQFHDRPVASATQLAERIRAATVGHPVPIRIQRRDRIVNLVVTPIKRI